jgi:hypothetical protein
LRRACPELQRRQQHCGILLLALSGLVVAVPGHLNRPTSNITHADTHSHPHPHAHSHSQQGVIIIIIVVILGVALEVRATQDDVMVMMMITTRCVLHPLLLPHVHPFLCLRRCLRLLPGLLPTPATHATKSAIAPQPCANCRRPGAGTETTPATGDTTPDLVGPTAEQRRPDCERCI